MPSPAAFRRARFPAEAYVLLADLELPLYDRVINASHAPLGCWLAGAIPCTNPSARFGGVIVDRECLYLGAASVYRVAMLQFREQNLFNLVDLIRAIAGGAPPSVPARLYVNQSAELPFALPAGRLVALNPGANDATRCWAAENFARLAESLIMKQVSRRSWSARLAIANSAKKLQPTLVSRFRISRVAPRFQKWRLCSHAANWSSPPTPAPRISRLPSVQPVSASMAPLPGSAKPRRTATTTSFCKRRSTTRCLQSRSILLSRLQ